MAMAPTGRKTRPDPELRPPTDAERKQAAEVGLRLDAALGEASDSGAIRLPADLEIPGLAAALLGQILDELSRGNAVRLERIRPTLSIAMAAHLLNAPTSYVKERIEAGELPCRSADPFSISLTDLLAFKKADDAARELAFAELVALGQEMSAGDEP